jgi:non-specific serine/threonine protein kinase/serine/threonine-protein kinase
VRERWIRIGEIFDAALREPAERRSEFLEEACGGDRDLEAEVRSLLASHGAADEFLEPGKARLELPPDALPAIPAMPAAGQTIGSWKIIRPLAEGGMGIVYLVERQDGQYQQRGALKFIRHGLATEEMVRRFRRERQILASLDHPNVARLLDGGTNSDGLPWLVMEYVEGVPLYQWCSEHAPTLRDRLGLFLTLCGSVDAAHRRLILHRDLKPGNVLVTADGAPRLLDFGVAKIFSTDGVAPDAELTTLRAPLTPEYASPEQLRGEEVSTSSDVYSLGVLLYELVTGARPYPTRAEGAAALVRTVLEKDPVRPSTAVAETATMPAAPQPATRTLPLPPAGGSAALGRALAGDLDNIVLKALSKETTRRYPSVEQLATDIRRYLDGRPVQARPSTWSYRASKFVRRNRTAVAMAAVTALALVAGTVFSLWNAAEARRERIVAERRLRDVTVMANTVLWDVNEGLAEIPGTTPLREKVVDMATHYLNKIAAEGVQDTALVRTLADAFDKLGTVQGYAWSANVGKSAEAYRSFKQAYALRETLVRGNPSQEEYLLDLASAATKLCNHDREHGNIEEAATMSHRALDLMTQLRTAHPETRRYRINVPRLLHNDGLTLIEAGKVDEGIAQIRRGLDEFSALAAWEPDDPSHRRAVAQASTGLAEALILQPGTTDSVLAVLGRARSILEDLVRDAPDDVALHRRLGAVHYDTGRTLLLRSRDADGALREAAACATMTRAAVHDDPGNEDAVVSHLIARAFEGHALAAAGRTAPAERTLREVMPHAERLARADTTDVRFPQLMVEARLGMGLVEVARAKGSNGAAADTHWRRARDWLRAARREHQRIAAREGSWSLSREESESIVAALDDCERALGMDRLPDHVRP